MNTFCQEILTDMTFVYMLDLTEWFVINSVCLSLCVWLLYLLCIYQKDKYGTSQKRCNYQLINGVVDFESD